MSRERSSFDSIREATDDKSAYSGHGKAAGQAGYRDPGNLLRPAGDFLNESGASRALSVPEGQFQSLRVTLSWNNIVVESQGFLGRLLGKVTKAGVDLDLGCLYELKDGRRGSVQAFGGMYGSRDQSPYIHHTGDERTGDKPGEDEAIAILGANWENVKRFLVYAYVYHGPTSWDQIKPEMRIVVPGETPMIVTPSATRSDLPICALATVKNLENGVHLTNHSEYYSSHPAMDRAFGYGIQWEDGAKE